MAPTDEDAQEPVFEQALKEHEKTSVKLQRAADAYYAATPEERAAARAEYIRAIQEDSHATFRAARARKKP